MDNDLTAFLGARYDEAEARERGMLEMLAKAGPDATLAICFDDGTSSNAADYNPWDFIADYNPAHRLADIKGKRAILALHPRVKSHDGDYGCETCDWDSHCEMVGGNERWCLTVRQLGTEFEDHPDYQEAWKP